MKVFFVTNRKPRSHNGRGSGDVYKDNLKNDFLTKYAHLYQGLPISNKTLQAHVVFLHQFRKGNIPDADNVSKPVVDAFSGVIYEDDNLIIRRTADILSLNDFDFVTVDATDMPDKIYDDFNNYYLNGEKNIIFYEVSEFSPSQIKIGEV